MRFTRVGGVLGAVLTLLLVACSRPQSDPKPFMIEGLPVTLRMTQRSTATVPGSGDRLVVTLDDITRGQVMATVRFAPSEVALGPMSMHAGGSYPFECGGSEFELRLTEFEQAIFGDDSATIVIDVRRHGLSESDKIDALITSVERLEGATFLRNGEEHAASAAAEHLRRKRAAAGASLTTAAAFIDGAATKSSLTGRQYEIRFADGRVLPLAEYLRVELAKLDSAGT